MFTKRIIPSLLLNDKKLVKTKKFKDPVYIGDPINAIRIFNEKEVDELLLIDINASKNRSNFNIDYLKDLFSECFMPVSFGGGIESLAQIEKLLYSGIEKVLINTAIAKDLAFLEQAAQEFGSSTIIAGIDYKKNFWGQKKVYINSGKVRLNFNPIEYSRILEDNGAGEILLTNINREGTASGYDHELASEIVNNVKIPIVINGGAATYADFRQAFQIANVSAVAAGSLFVYSGPHKAVLINYPSQQEIAQVFKKEE